MIQNVKLNSMEDIKRLNSVATDEHYDMSVNCGHVIIDAKSLLALFSLIGQEVTLVAADGASPKQFENAVKRMKLASV